MMPARTQKRRDAGEARHVYCSGDVCTCRSGHPNRWTDCGSDSASVVTSGCGCKSSTCPTPFGCAISNWNCIVVIAFF